VPLRIIYGGGDLVHEPGNRVPGARTDALLTKETGHAADQTAWCVSNRMAQSAQVRVEILPAHVDAELVGGNVLEVVGLVDNQVLILGQHAAFHRQVGQEQGVVHHHQVRPFSAVSRPVEEATALLAVRTAIPNARL